jgi:hypothetical protein
LVRKLEHYIFDKKLISKKVWGGGELEKEKRQCFCDEQEQQEQQRVRRSCSRVVTEKWKLGS